MNRPTGMGRVLQVCEVEPFTAVIEKPGYRFVHEGKTLILHLAMGGGQKSSYTY